MLLIAGDMEIGCAIGRIFSIMWDGGGDECAS